MRSIFYAVMAMVGTSISGWIDSAQAADPLPSWNEGPAKQSILDFVARVTKQGGPDFVPVSDRIATFDNDGTLWPEDPITFELAFAIARVKETAAAHPEWKDKQPFKAVLEDELPNLVGQTGKKVLVELILATHSGMTTGEFDRSVRDWISKAKHPRYQCLYADLAYQPMLEVLDYMRANGFKTFIVSGGGVEFMRVFADKLYGIPTEQVIGSMFKLQYELRNDKPLLTILPAVSYVDDKDGKAIAIQQLIGRHPYAAFGNSDGDLEMLQFTTIGRKPSFGLIVHHTDAVREYAYDAHPKSSGKLVEALREAPKRGWTVVDMKKDWKRIFAFDK